jgi:hypothetical protein
MPRQTIPLHAAAPVKPAYGAACNGCGVCCAYATCPLGRIVFLRRRGPCPALRWSVAQSRYHCGLAVAPGDYLAWLPAALSGFVARSVLRRIAANTGCDATVDTE